MKLYEGQVSARSVRVSTKSAGALVTTAGRSDDTALTHSVQILEIAEAVALVGLCFVRSICYLARADLHLGAICNMPGALSNEVIIQLHLTVT